MLHKEYDVVVIGGGLAGLTLSLQLKQANSAIRILVLEKRAEAAAEAARALQYTPVIVTDKLEGEARDKAVEFVQQTKQNSGKFCLLMGGETTVTIRGHGKGGRNQEFVLAAYTALRDHYPPDTWPVLLSAGTDGSDGPTDAAGAILDPALHARVSALGLSPL